MSTIGDNVSVYEIRRSVTFDAANESKRLECPRSYSGADRSTRNGQSGRCEAGRQRHKREPVDYGPGYRIYFARMERVVYLLLCGGTKDTQDTDIKRAIEMNAVRVSEARRRTQKKGK